MGNSDNEDQDELDFLYDAWVDPTDAEVDEKVEVAEVVDDVGLRFGEVTTGMEPDDVRKLTAFVNTILSVAQTPSERMTGDLTFEQLTGVLLTGTVVLDTGESVNPNMREHGHDRIQRALGFTKDQMDVVRTITDAGIEYHNGNVGVYCVASACKDIYDKYQMIRPHFRKDMPIVCAPISVGAIAVRKIMTELDSPLSGEVAPKNQEETLKNAQTRNAVVTKKLLRMYDSRELHLGYLPGIVKGNKQTPAQATIKYTGLDDPYIEDFLNMFNSEYNQYSLDGNFVLDQTKLDYRSLLIVTTEDLPGLPCLCVASSKKTTTARGLVILDDPNLLTPFMILIAQYCKKKGITPVFLLRPDNKADASLALILDRISGITSSITTMSPGSQEAQWLVRLIFGATAPGPDRGITLVERSETNVLIDSASGAAVIGLVRLQVAMMALYVPDFMELIRKKLPVDTKCLDQMASVSIQDGIALCNGIIVGSLQVIKGVRDGSPYAVIVFVNQIASFGYHGHYSVACGTLKKLAANLEERPFWRLLAQLNDYTHVHTEYGSEYSIGEGRGNAKTIPIAPASYIEAVSQQYRDCPGTSQMSLYADGYLIVKGPSQEYLDALPNHLSVDPSQYIFDKEFTDTVIELSDIPVVVSPNMTGPGSCHGRVHVEDIEHNRIALSDIATFGIVITNGTPMKLSDLPIHPTTDIPTSEHCHPSADVLGFISLLQNSFLGYKVEGSMADALVSAFPGIMITKYLDGVQQNLKLEDGAARFTGSRITIVSIHADDSQATAIKHSNYHINMPPCALSPIVFMAMILQLVRRCVNRTTNVDVFWKSDGSTFIIAVLDKSILESLSRARSVPTTVMLEMMAQAGYDRKSMGMDEEKSASKRAARRKLISTVTGVHRVIDKVAQGKSDARIQDAYDKTVSNAQDLADYVTDTDSEDEDGFVGYVPPSQRI